MPMFTGETKKRLTQVGKPPRHKGLSQTEDMTLEAQWKATDLTSFQSKN